MLQEISALQFDVVVIGAGAAGLMCALTAGERGRRVLVIDHANKAGKKILMSGGGRCNFTNMYVEPVNFLSNNPHFCKSALARYTQWDFISLVAEAGVPYHEKKLGQLFCDHKSSDILNLLLDKCDQNGVVIRLNTSIAKVISEECGFRMLISGGEVTCESLVVATGGLSIPTLGATGFGYEIARQFGHHVYPQRAALVPFVFTDQLKSVCEMLAGSSVDVIVECSEMSFRENILFTHRGLSGPAILQISSYWREGDKVSINLLPDRDVNDWLLGEKAQRPNIELKSLLTEVFTKKMAAWLCEDLAIAKPLRQLSHADISEVSNRLSNWLVTPSGTEGYRTAEVTLGGVDTRELSSKTMESNLQKGLYFVGEVVDVTGWLGGYNFQWAWSSGRAAGEVV